MVKKLANKKFEDIDNQILRSFSFPSFFYIMLIALCNLLVLGGLIGFGVQWALGMGTNGLNIPVGWAMHIANYVFWIAVAMSGTFISAMLFLFRTDWRSVINRVAETMTIFGIAVAGLFPIIHLGRNWVFFWVLPYPNWRHLWPNFKSPLVWDVLAIITYFTISVLIFYLGLLPDIAAIRDKVPKGWRKSAYKLLSLGWTGRYEQWREYTRAYLVLAVLGMPIAMSVHSVVAFDFSMSLLPGWHSTFYAPYFVAGAINSGLATIVSLLIPLRKTLHLEKIFLPRYFQQMAMLMVLMGWILGYYYGEESFMDWYSGNIFIRQFSVYRGMGSGYYSSIFWITIVCVVFVPMTFLFKKLRTNLRYLFVAAIFVNLGMWLERYMLVITPLTHGYLPTQWGIYVPHAPESLITGMAIGMFLGLFLIFIKIFPSVAVNDVKKLAQEHLEVQHEDRTGQG